MGMNMTDENSQNLAFEIGKISGQLRELLHTTNNNTQQLLALAATVSQLTGLPETIAELNARVVLLERQQNKLDGEKGVLAALFKSPAFMWFAGTMVALYVFIQDRMSQ